MAVGFNRRFAPATKLLKEAFRRNGPPATVFYRIADDDRIRPPEQQWKNADRLLTETVHIFDLLAYLLDSEPVCIDARTTRPNDDLVLIDYANGSHAAILSSSYGSLLAAQGAPGSDSRPRHRGNGRLRRGAKLRP